MSAHFFYAIRNEERRELLNIKKDAKAPLPSLLKTFDSCMRNRPIFSHFSLKILNILKG